MRHLTYRPELDGLRAIAVTAVVLFHVGFPSMPGGYVGVDVFFVLSGYLICGQTYLRLQAGDYSARDFFARRIRRLAMAYFTCFLVTALVASMLFLPEELGTVFANLLGSTTFTNNYNLLASQGYFNTAAHENPFLHTWSLSIEEQFYIALPLLILATGRSLRVFRATLAGVLAVSLALALASGDVIHDREARFFSTTFRLWELALGGLLFVLLHRRGGALNLPLAPVVGLVLVLLPVGWLDAGTLYPAWGTLLPTLGTAILIATALPAHSMVGRLLATRPMVYLGRISYGTYLWHWPLIVFVTYVNVDLDDVLRSVLTLASFALGALSYHLLEMPVRRIDVARHRGRLFAMFAVQTAVLLGVAGWLYQQSHAAAPMLGERLARIKAEDRAYPERWNACWLSPGMSRYCRIGDPEAAARPFLVWGDSMANSALWAFETFAGREGQGGYLAPTASCAPVIGVSREFSGDEECLAVNRAVLTFLQEAPATDVYMFARWSYYAEGYEDHRSDTPGTVPLVDGRGAPPEGETRAVFAAALDRTLAAIPDRHRVTLIGQVPVFPYAVPRAMLRQHRFGTVPPVKTVADFMARSGGTVAMLRAAAATAGARLIEPHRVFCKDETCVYAADGVPLLSDHVHLSRAGNALLADLLARPPAGGSP
ncbi:acyltransferase family protein [Roseovarius salinarum]|uniref:acyltransferase family protein n=1 Tax=Roseovarius salinarum TaxID=1981892 RepID=UPI000C326A7B|nr:acyltransferase family protein [Roseovarius salinarum]